MHPRQLAWTLAVAIVPAVYSTALASDLSFTTRTDDDRPIVTCDDIDMRFWKGQIGSGGIVTVRRSQPVALRADPATPLKVNASNRGGVRVQPSSDGKLSAFVCMAAGAKSESAGEAILDGLRIESDRGELSVAGPEDGDWAAFIILSVPPAMSLDLNADNGGLVLRDVNGRFTLRTTNGPIKLKGVGGVIDAETQNGPIKYRGHAGDVRLVAQNGPVDVHLDADDWIGKGLEGSTQNGPIKLMVPPGLKSGVLVEGSASSPARWNGVPQPIQTQATGSRSFRFGDGPVMVRLSTVNGPLKIQAPQRGKQGVEI